MAARDDVGPGGTRGRPHGARGAGALAPGDPADFGGCFVPRHIDWDPAIPLSMHAWGLAVDLAVSQNALGAEPAMDRRVVEVFDAQGFVWGGRWSRPDGMHFELRVAG